MVIIIKFSLFKNNIYNEYKMDNEEIMRRIKIHSAMFDKYEDIFRRDNENIFNTCVAAGLCFGIEHPAA